MRHQFAQQPRESHVDIVVQGGLGSPHLQVGGTEIYLYFSHFLSQLKTSVGNNLLPQRNDFKVKEVFFGGGGSGKLVMPLEDFCLSWKCCITLLFKLSGTFSSPLIYQMEAAERFLRKI